MLCANRVQYRQGLSVAKENLAFAVDDIFLKIQGNLLILAEILHILRHCDAGLFADMEERIYQAAGGENYCGVVQNIYVLSPETACGNGVYCKKRAEIEREAILCLKLCVWRIVLGGRLGNQDFLSS